MTGFFNNENKLRRSLQVLNIVALFVAGYNLYSEPEKSMEHGINLATHALSLISFDEGLNLVLTTSSDILGAVVVVTQIHSDGSLTLKAADGLVHLVNAAFRVKLIIDADNAEIKEESKKSNIM